jgi:uncharacterized membrane protein YphA (DoxX/SURF4 family)
VFAHETWFKDAPGGMDWSFAGETTTIALLAAAVVVTLLVRLIARFWPGVDVPFLARMAPFMPFAIRLHVGVALIGLLSLGVYLSPAMDLEFDVAGVVLGANMVVTAVLLIAGWHTRAAALLLIALGPIGMLEFGVSPVLQRIDMFGVALYVLLAGPGRWSADHEAGRAQDPTPDQAAQAIWALRVCAGLALIIVAFVEKLADPELARAFLADHPDLNLAAQLGLPMGATEFIRVAGAIEVLFGLLLISGALPQAIVLIAGIPFNATLFFFGNSELVGHLPIYGTMLVLLVYGSDPALRPGVSALWPWGQRRRSVTDRDRTRLPRTVTTAR